MAEHGAGDGATQNSSNEHGVLANLPRTRPQRSTPRRAAARNSGSARSGGSGRDTKSGSPRTRTRGESAAPTTKPKRARTSARNGAGASSSSSKRAPAQGYESSGEPASGSVQPPGAVELLASAAELFGELTKSGLSRGERLLKDIASRLPLS